MNAILAIFTSRLAGPISSVFALLFLGLALTQCVGKAAETHRADIAERQFAVADKDRAQCVTSRMALEGSIATQNAALADLHHEAAIRTAAAQIAVTDALKGRAGAEAKAAKLLKTPPAGIDACARAMSAFDAVKGSLQ